MRTRVLGGGLALLAALALCGCLVVNRSESTVRAGGSEIGAATLGQIEPGKTTRNWLVATLGRPTEVNTVSENEEVLRYESRTVQERRLHILLLYGGDHEVERVENVYFEIENGIVMNYWRD